MENDNARTGGTDPKLLLLKQNCEQTIRMCKVLVSFINKYGDLKQFFLFAEGPIGELNNLHSQYNKIYNDVMDDIYNEHIYQVIMHAIAPPTPKIEIDDFIPYKPKEES